MRADHARRAAVVPAFVVLAVVAGCQGFQSAEAQAPSASVVSPSPTARPAPVTANGLAVEQEADAAAVVEDLRVAAEAEAARAAAEQTAAAAPEPAGGGTPTVRASSGAGAGGVGTAATPPPAPAPAPGGDLLLSNMSCNWDGATFIMGFTATFESGLLYRNVSNYNSPGGPFISRLDGYDVIGGNFTPYGNCGN